MISVVIPVFNEEGNLTKLFSELNTVFTTLSKEFEAVFVDDGSSDGSIEELERLSEIHPEVKYVKFTRNFGHQVAVIAGLEASKGDQIVLIDADGQDPPKVIIELYKKHQEGYDIVSARRNSREGETVIKKGTAKLFYKILDYITDIKIPRDTGDFRIIDRKVRDALLQMKEQHKFLRGQMAWLGFSHAEVIYDREERWKGETGYNFRKMFRFAIDGITSFSRLPLRLATVMGFVCAFIGFLLILYTLYSKFVLDDYEKGWPSLMITIIFLGGIQLFTIGIIGEYISRMNENIKNRPLYVIEKKKV